MKSSTATATTATGNASAYVGRFAPSPSGDLHLGSLLTAVASFLDARANHGRWLLRIEDLDRHREQRGATSRILNCLESFGFEWDGAVVRQSTRAGLYEAALETLRQAGRLYRCGCSRRRLREEQRYPGTCRLAAPPAGTACALRFCVDPVPVQFQDGIQGCVAQHPASHSGDFIVKRRDGIIAYALAVVVDDADQGVTHIVRGADLLEHSGGQILLQRVLGLPQPAYAHVPVLTEPGGDKLAKSRRSSALGSGERTAQLLQIAALLGLSPPTELRQMRPSGFWDWAIANWDVKKIPRCPALALI